MRKAHEFALVRALVGGEGFDGALQLLDAAAEGDFACSDLD